MGIAKTIKVYDEIQALALLRDALLIPFAPEELTEFMVPGFIARLRLVCNNHRPDRYSEAYLKDSTIRGVYCCACLSRVGYAMGGALVLSCPNCKPFEYPDYLVCRALRMVVNNTYAVKAACQALDERHKFWSRDHDPE